MEASVQNLLYYVHIEYVVMYITYSIFSIINYYRHYMYFIIIFHDIIYIKGIKKL
jgi:hypothetical protein